MAQAQNLEKPMIQFRTMRSIAHLEQLFTFVDITSLPQYLINCPIHGFSKVYEGNLCAKPSKGFHYVKKYNSSFRALIIRFINLLRNR